MDDSLRPLSTRQLLAITFSLYRRHFKLLVGVSILGPVATSVCPLLHVSGALAVARLDARAALISTAVGVLVCVTIMLLAGLAISSAATAMAVASVRLGREVRAFEVYRALKGRIWRILGVVLSVFLRAFLSAALFLGLGMIALALAAALGYNSRVEAGTIGFVCGGIALLAAILVAARIYLRYAVAVQACVVEDISRKLALERSAFLTEGASIRVAAVWGVFVLLSFGMGFVLEVPALLLRGQAVAFQVSSVAACVIAGALTAPVGTIGLSLLYFDQRLRKDGFAGRQ